MGLFIRTIGLARATTKIGLANLVYNIKRMVWLNHQRWIAAPPARPRVRDTAAAARGLFTAASDQLNTAHPARKPGLL